MSKINICLFALTLLPALLRAETLDQFNKTGGFEIPGWSLTEAGWNFKGTERWISEQEPRSGKKALKLWDDSEAHTLDLTISKELTGLATGTYELSFWYRGDFMSVDVQSGKESLAIASAPAWKEYKLKITSTGAPVPLTLIFKGAKNSKPWAWLDDMSVKKSK